MIYLIVPTHNDVATISTFVECLNRQTVKPFVVWIDSREDHLNLHEIQKCECCGTRLRVSQDKYWAGMLQVGQEWILKNPWVKSDYIVAVMNNDITFDSKYFEMMQSHHREDEITASVDDGVRILWNKIWTRKHGAISVIPSWQPNALSNRAVFLSVENFRKVKFYPRLLPHYCSDYAWTYQLIKSGVAPFIPLDCKIKVDYSTTGITDPKTVTQLFKKRCMHNPIYYTIFILMCCPWKWKIQNIVRVWGYAFVRVLRMYLGR